MLVIFLFVSEQMKHNRSNYNNNNKGYGILYSYLWRKIFQEVLWSAISYFSQSHLKYDVQLRWDERNNEGKTQKIKRINKMKTIWLANMKEITNEIQSRNEDKNIILDYIKSVKM